MKPKKPITNKMAEKANALFEIMKDNRWHTKEELGEKLGIKNERSVRDVISTLSKRKPIIATSDGKGYKMAMRVCDKDEVRHAWMEIDSRIEELEARRETLKAFYDKAQAKGGKQWHSITAKNSIG